MSLHTRCDIKVRRILERIVPRAAYFMIWVYCTYAMKRGLRKLHALNLWFVCFIVLEAGLLQTVVVPVGGCSNAVGCSTQLKCSAGARVLYFAPRCLTSLHLKTTWCGVAWWSFGQRTFPFPMPTTQDVHRRKNLCGIWSERAVCYNFSPL